MARSDNEDFTKLITDVLLDWLQRGELHTMVAQPPLAPAGAAQIDAAREPLLKVNRGRKATGGLVAWPRLGLEAKPTPFLTFVVQGTVDLQVGVTERMAMDERVNVRSGLYRVRLPSRHVLIYPAGVPHPDGARPHWDSKAEEPPDSTILWLDLLPEGAHLHTCHSRRGEHVHGESRFVVDSRLLLIFDSMMEELQMGTEQSIGPFAESRVADLLLEVLLLRVARSLSRQEAHYVSDHFLIRSALSLGETGENPCRSPQSSLVGRACDYIRGRLNQRLSVAKIAHHTLVSPAQLNRLFRAEMNQSVMEYVTEQRLKTAKSLLSNTALPVNIIGKNVGVANAVYFSRLFREKTGMTPQQYRSQKGVP